MARPKKKKANIHGLYSRNFPTHVRWRIDQDYGSTLSQAEKEWLSKFNDAFYGHKFTEEVGKDWTAAQKAEAYHHDNGSRRDAYRSVVAAEELPLLPVGPGGDDLERGWDETPEYLNSAEYKQAREDYRKTLSPKPARGYYPKPEKTRAFHQARRKLDVTIPHVVEDRTDEEEN